MPIYEYKCNECGAEIEEMQKITDDPLTDCPECGKPALSRLISRTSFKLTGTGWYETDFKDKSQSGKANTAAGSEPSKSNGDNGKAKETTTDSKDKNEKKEATNTSSDKKAASAA